MELENMMLNDARIALNDGPGFGVEGRGFMRLNFACPRAVLTEALSRINKALKDRL
jgi:cystathionine beta-lyase